jgi:hypothetical protein
MAQESAASLIERIGDLPELAVKQEQPAFYGTVQVHRKGVLWSSWSELFAVVADGSIRLYASRTAAAPEETYALSVRSRPLSQLLAPGRADAPPAAPHHGASPRALAPRALLPLFHPQSCTGGVRELEDCKADYYCFELRAGDCGAGGDKAPRRLRLCAGSSAEQQLWLQALTQGGVKYEELGDGSVGSLHDLAASEMMGGEQVRQCNSFVPFSSGMNNTYSPRTLSTRAIPPAPRRPPGEQKPGGCIAGKEPGRRRYQEVLLCKSSIKDRRGRRQLHPYYTH